MATRFDENEECREISLCDDLQATSRWSGIGDIDGMAAQAIGLILVANSPLVAEIRSAHIPLSLLGIV